MPEDYCLRCGAREKLYCPESTGGHLRCFKIMDTASAQMYLHITYICMPPQGELQGQGDTSSELIPIAMCVFEKTTLPKMTWFSS